MNKQPFEHHIPQKLLYLRTVTNRTTQELADVCKVRRVTYEGYEKGRTCPSLVKLVDFCNFYGVSMEYMLSLDNEDDDKKFAYRFIDRQTQNTEEQHGDKRT